MPDHEHSFEKISVKIRRNLLSIYPQRTGKFLKTLEFVSKDGGEGNFVKTTVKYNYPEAKLLFIEHLLPILYGLQMDNLPEYGRLPTDKAGREAYHLDFGKVIDTDILVNMLKLFEQKRLISETEKDACIEAHADLSAQPTDTIPAPRKIYYVREEPRFFTVPKGDSKAEEASPRPVSPCR